MQAATESCWMYGDPKSHDLRNALAAHHGVDAAAVSAATTADVAEVVRAALAPANTSWHVIAPRERARFGFRRR